jgi:hypothetical protein
MKKILLVLLFTSLNISVFAQKEEEENGRKGKFFLIPEIWLSFGSSTYIDLSPMVGYHILDRLVVGLGPHYIYQSMKSTPYYPAYQTHSYGLKGFSRFSLITNAEQWLPIKLFSELYVQAEYDGLSMENEYYVPPYTEEGRTMYHGFLVGGGVAQRIGMYNTITFTVLWDVSESYLSPYSNPVFRVGFNAFL